MSRIEFDRDPGHADVAGHARMVAVVAAVGGEIEGDREALLPGGEVAAVEGVAVLGRGEAGILPDRPGLGRVHGGVGAAQERRQAGPGAEEIQARDVGGRVERRHRDAFGRRPGQLLRRVAGCGGERLGPGGGVVGRGGLAQRQVGEARDRGHGGLTCLERVGSLERLQHVRRQHTRTHRRPPPPRRRAVASSGRPIRWTRAQWACFSARAAGSARAA